MSRSFRNSLEIEAEYLHAEARHIESELACAGLSDDQLLAASRALVEPRDNAVIALREAKRAIDSISPLGIGRRPT